MSRVTISPMAGQPPPRPGLRDRIVTRAAARREEAKRQGQDPPREPPRPPAPVSDDVVDPHLGTD